jgi:hypothetical protein
MRTRWLVPVLALACVMTLAGSGRAQEERACRARRGDVCPRCGARRGDVAQRDAAERAGESCDRRDQAEVDEARGLEREPGLLPPFMPPGGDVRGGDRDEGDAEPEPMMMPWFGAGPRDRGTMGERAWRDDGPMPGRAFRDAGAGRERWAPARRPPMGPGGPGPGRLGRALRLAVADLGAMLDEPAPDLRAVDLQLERIGRICARMMRERPEGPDARGPGPALGRPGMPRPGPDGGEGGDDGPVDGPR